MPSTLKGIPSLYRGFISLVPIPTTSRAACSSNILTQWKLKAPLYECRTFHETGSQVFLEQTAPIMTRTDSHGERVILPISIIK